MFDFLANLVRPDVSIPAYAKINLTLEVLGKREDGYHAIRSIVIPIGLHDDVRITANDSGEITVETIADSGIDTSAIGPSEKNIAVRAARLFLSRLGAKTNGKLTEQPDKQGGANRIPKFGAHIRIFKRIPLGGGLGGGSADGAATLKGLNEMFADKPFSMDELMEMAAEVGSDIPSMVHGGTVLMEGRGEKVTALADGNGFSPFRPYHVVLANPGINVSTAEAYGKCHAQDDGLTSTPFLDNILRSPNYGGKLEVSAKWLFNGLEEPVFAMHPEIQRLAAEMKDAGTKGVLMSGSGATVFAQADSREDAERIERRVSAECRWHVITETLPDGVMAAHGPLEARVLVRIQIGQPPDPR